MTPPPLRYDPADPGFWAAARQIPGFPLADNISLRWMVIESGALFRLPALLAEFDPQKTARLLVVMDPTPMRRGPDSLKPLALDILRRAGWEVEPLELQPDETGQVHTTMDHIETVQRRLSPGVMAFALGSGVITDITKHACYLYEQAGSPRPPFVVYQTANSVSAYTSNMAPVFVDGVKRTLPSRYPDGLVCDLETLRDAPLEMTLAGVGDLLAAYVSLPDWLLAHRLGMDPSYTGLPQALIGPLDEIVLAHAEGIRSATLDGMAVLAKLISLGGLAMSLAHATTPMSGYEHVMSHILDLLNETAHAPLAQHGTQVSLSAILGAAVYQVFLDEFDPQALNIERCYPDPAAMERQVRQAFGEIDPSGKAGEECWSDYRQKLEKWLAQRADLVAFLANWPAERASLRALTCPPERLQAVLAAIGAPLTFARLQPPFDESAVRFAFLNAPLMRKRLTIGDLLIFFNWDRPALWERIWRATQTTLSFE